MACYLLLIPSCSLFLPEQLKEVCSASLFTEDGTRGIIFSHPMNRESVEAASRMILTEGYARSDLVQSYGVDLPLQWEGDRKYCIPESELPPPHSYALHITGLIESATGMDYSGPKTFILAEYPGMPPGNTIESVLHQNGESVEACSEFPYPVEGVDRASRFIITFSEPLQEYQQELFCHTLSMDPPGVLEPEWDGEGRVCTLTFTSPLPWELLGMFFLPKTPYPVLYHCNGPREIPLQWDELQIDGVIQESGSFIQSREGEERHFVLVFSHSPEAFLSESDLVEGVGFSLQGGAGYLDIGSVETTTYGSDRSSITFQGIFRDCEPGLLLNIEVSATLKESLGKSITGNRRLTINVEE